MDIDFGSSLLKTLHDVLEWVTGINSFESEAILSQILNIEQILILLNHISTQTANLGISEEDKSDLMHLCDVFNYLRTDLVKLQINRSRNATICAILEISTCANNGTPGRPKIAIQRDVLEELRGICFSWDKIAKILNVSRWTVLRRVNEYSLQDLQRFTDMSDEEIDSIVKDYIDRHGPTTGEPFMSGFFRSKGITIQRRRIRESLNRVDPKNTAARWGAVIKRRSYFVPWQNSLWYLDGHHSLIRWKFVIHGCIDGKSRKIMFLHCSSNNLAETVNTLFLNAIRDNGNFWPSRIRVDYGVENVLVCDEMVNYRGLNRNSFIAGPSTRNQRIERLWRDVFRCVAVTFYYTFYAMEQTGILDLDNELHLFVLHHIFLARINYSLSEFKALFNDHRLTTENNWTPNQIWYNGMINPNNPLSFQEGLDENIGDQDYFGEDPTAPFPFSEDNNVSIEPIVIENPNELSQFINDRLDVNRPSSNMGIDVYVEALELLEHEFPIRI